MSFRQRSSSRFNSIGSVVEIDVLVIAQSRIIPTLLDDVEHWQQSGDHYRRPADLAKNSENALHKQKLAAYLVSSMIGQSISMSTFPWPVSTVVQSDTSGMAQSEGLNRSPA